MDTKEMIEFLEYMINKKDSKWEIRVYGELLEVIKRGKKYEQIVKEIKYEIDWHRPEREVYDSGSKGDDKYINETLDLIDVLEQKYFPKGE